MKTKSPCPQKQVFGMNNWIPAFAGMTKKESGNDSGARE